MGSRLSPIFANVDMEQVESRELKSYKGATSSRWFSYVDDTWVKIKTEEVEAFMEHINLVDRNIKFTREDAKDHNCLFWTVPCTLKRTEVLTLRFTGNLHILTSTCFLTHISHYNTNWLSSECYGECTYAG